MLSAEDVYAFTHAIMQEAAYQLLPPSARSHLHSEAIELLSALREPPAADIALHARRGQGGAQPEESARLLELERRWVEIAADHAERSFRILDAVRFLQRLVELQPPGSPERVPVLCRLVELLISVDRYREALQAAELAMSEARLTNDKNLIAAGARALGVSMRDGTRNAESEEHFLIASDLYRELENDRELAQALLGLSGTLWIRGRLDEAAKYIEEGWQAATRTGDPGVSARAAMNRLGIAIEDGRFVDARAYIKDVERLVGETGDPSARMRLHSFRAYAYDVMGEKQAAREDYEHAMRYARQLGSLIEVARCETNLATLDASERRYLKARERHATAERIARELGDLRVSAYAVVGQGAIDVLLGDYRSAIERFHTGLRLADKLGMDGIAETWTVSAAALHAELGDLETAETLLKSVSVQRDTYEERARLAILAVIASRRGQRSEARELARRSSQCIVDAVLHDPLMEKWIKRSDELLAAR